MSLPELHLVIPKYTGRQYHRLPNKASPLHSPPRPLSVLCGRSAPRAWEVSRTAIDVDLDGPVFLVVTVGVHHCRRCEPHFRAQPPFLRPNAIYTERVRQKATLSVYEDGMAVRRVTGRLARDFWVSPSEAMVRRWCHEYAESVDFCGDYQAWVLEEFSGVLCVDEVYQDKLALLLAVDPPLCRAAIGWWVINSSMDRLTVRRSKVSSSDCARQVSSLIRWSPMALRFTRER